MGLTLKIAERVAKAHTVGFSNAALETAQLGFMDTIATTFAGAGETAAKKANKFAERRKISESGMCALPWLPNNLPVSMAALVTGTAAHALDYDDVALSGHPSAVIVPALLCEGVSRDLSGAKCLEAYVVGYEVWAELFRRESDSLHSKGWHPTAFYGVLAATAALAYIRRLSVDNTATALALAASFASGLVSNFGTMTKPLHAGRAASLAFDALEYTALGLTSSHDTLEHQRGFLSAISPHARVDCSSNLHETNSWAAAEHGLCIKQYPVCYGAHRAIDGMIDLALKHNLGLDDVKQVSVGLGPAQLAMLRNNRPHTGLEAKFSIEFAMAAAIDQKNVGLMQLTNGYVSQSRIQEFFDRVTSWDIEIPALDNDPTFSSYDQVDITLLNGRTLSSGEIKYPRGHAKNPVNKIALHKKFVDCLCKFRVNDCENFSTTQANLLFEKVNNMASCSHMSLIFSV